MNFLTRVTYSPPGSRFFDRVEVPEQELFPAAVDEVPAGWHRRAAQPWVLMQHENGNLPPQGWKVHVSATLGSSDRVLETVFEYLTTRTEWTFKFIDSRDSLFRRGSKYGDRSASGKFVTVYPPDVAALERCLAELGELLEGEPGPYLLSDLRWRNGPLYLRYGGFVERFVTGPSGERQHVIEAPDGTLVPDRRGVSFRIPDGVPVPAVLEPALEARGRGTLADFPYRVTRALHFSNAGGIYRAEHIETGAQVLLREARPNAGEDAEGLDAVARLLREQAMLERLQGLPGIPRLVERRTGHEHTYLVRDFVPGRTLATLLTENPLTAGGTEDGGELRRYRDRMLPILARVESAVRGIHERGVVFGDLQPGNIIVDEDDRVVLIDFETASLVEEHRGQAVATPGFVAPAGTTGPAVDRFALGNLKLAVFWPVPTVFGWHPALFERIAREAAALFELPEDFLAGAREDIASSLPDPVPAPLLAGNAVVEAPVWPELVVEEDRSAARRDVAAGLLALATPERRDRLFPGDPASVHEPEGGLDLRTGAAGVLWSLHRAGEPIPEDLVGWLEEQALSERLRRHGLLDGAAGVAWVLHLLGRTESAVRLADQALAGVEDSLDASYGSGSAGVGWVLARLAAGLEDGRLLLTAEAIADRLAASTEVPRVAGLVSGASGAAVLWEELRRSGRGERWRAPAAAALAQDARVFADLTRPGTASPDPTSRTALLTSLSHGGGTALFADRLLADGAEVDPVLVELVRTVASRAADCRRLEVGLFQGEAGRLAVSSALGGRVRPDELGGLGLFSLGHEGLPVFFGGSGLRLSADLSTGAAGLLAALAALDGGELLPGVEARSR